VIRLYPPTPSRYDAAGFEVRHGGPIMRRCVLAFACLAALAPFAVAQTFDKAAFRQAIAMPAIATSFGVNFKASEREGNGNIYDPKAKIAELAKKLTGGPEDAEIYLDQRAVFLECLHDEKNGKLLLDKARAVLEPIKETTDPRRGWLVAMFASIMEATADNPWQACEGWARRAVSVSPQDWRTWTYLAHARHQQIPTIVCGGDDKLLSKSHRTHELIGMLVRKRALPEHVDAAEKALNEAMQYHDKAKALAPNEPKRQVQRYGFRLAETVMRNAFAVARGQKPPYPIVQLERTMLDELQETARLHPDHLLWQSQLVHQLTIVGWQDMPEKDRAAKKFRASRPADEQAIREALGRIEKLAEQGKGGTALYCYSMLAALQYSLGEHPAVEKTARKILAIDAKNQSAWEQLLQSLVLQERNADYLRDAQSLAKMLPSPRNCFLLGKALAVNQRYELAEHACAAGLTTDKGDVHCALGMAALVLRKGDDVQSLKMAEDLLSMARQNCRPEHGAVVYTELEYLAAAHEALSGGTVIARLKLQRLQEENPDNPRYEKLLNVLGR
jgi:tetratricopeptide (TPR) repeat protein